MRLEEVAKTDPRDYKIFLDMDGVLVDFVAGMDMIMDEKYDEEQYQTSSTYRTAMWKTVAEASEGGVKVWGQCPPMKDMKKLWNYVKKHKPEIMSATGNPKYGAEAQKREWAKKYLSPKMKVNLVRQAKEKAQHAKENYILIDDMSKAIDPWVAAGGIGILHTSAVNTIKELKKLGL